jgi:quercetin dioxygenase-like cupin family protein
MNQIENILSLHIPERLLDASILNFDLQEVIEKIKQEDPWKRGERNAITLQKSKCMRIVLIALHAQKEVNFHQSGNLVSVQIIEGKVDFQTENQSVIFKKGCLLTFHENIKHSLKAVEDSVFLLTIAVCPVNSI